MIDDTCNVQVKKKLFVALKYKRAVATHKEQVIEYVTSIGRVPRQNFFIVFYGNTSSLILYRQFHISLFWKLTQFSDD